MGPEARCEVVKDEAPTNGRREIVLDLAKEVSMDVLSGSLPAFMSSY